MIKSFVKWGKLLSSVALRTQRLVAFTLRRIHHFAVVPLGAVPARNAEPAHPFAVSGLLRPSQKIE